MPIGLVKGEGRLKGGGGEGVPPFPPFFYIYTCVHVLLKNRQQSVYSLTFPYRLSLAQLHHVHVHIQHTMNVYMHVIL